MSASAAVLVIDMQIGLVSIGYQGHEVLVRIADLLDRARRATQPILHVQHHHSTYAPLMAGAPTSLEDELRRLGTTQLIITGMQTEFCVDTTCRRALSLGFDVTLVSDAHTTKDALLPAEQIIKYHNSVLPALAHPDRRLLVKPSSEILF